MTTAKVNWPKMHKETDKQFRIWVLPHRYSIDKLLGAGAYGAVIQANDKETGKIVAIKKMKDAWNLEVDGVRLLREAQILQHLRHHNIVHLLDILPPAEDAVFRDLYLVMEKCDADLERVIYSPAGLQEDQMQYIMYQIFKAFKYIHSAGVVHRDVKPSNIMINKDVTIKIGDFGLARFIGEEKDCGHTSYVQTRPYRAPEVLAGSPNPIYDSKADMWSVGCVLGEMLGRKYLAYGRKNAADQMNCILQFIGTPSEEDIACIENQYARAHIRSTSYKRPDWSTIFPKASKDALDLLDKLLAFNPKKRISAAEALAHPFVKRYSQPETEPECVRPRPADYFSAAEAPEEVLRAYAWKEVYKFHPELDPSKQQKAQPMDVVQEKINDDSKQSDIDVQ